MRWLSPMVLSSLLFGQTTVESITPCKLHSKIFVLPVTSSLFLPTLDSFCFAGWESRQHSTTFTKLPFQKHVEEDDTLLLLLTGISSSENNKPKFKRGFGRRTHSLHVASKHTGVDPKGIRTAAKWLNGKYLLPRKQPPSSTFSSELGSRKRERHTHKSKQCKP